MALSPIPIELVLGGQSPVAIHGFGKVPLQPKPSTLNPKPSALNPQP